MDGINLLRPASGQTPGCVICGIELRGIQAHDVGEEETWLIY
ncbi:hypothetical protein ACR77U_12290 [Enterococcus faecium]